jgi:hypothetical protein
MFFSFSSVGGQLTSSPGDCTVLVTDNIRRTAKFLCAIGKGLPIVSHRWLLASKNAKMFLGNKKFYVCFTVCLGHSIICTIMDCFL